MKQFKNMFILLLTALIWGFAFVAQSVSMDHIGAFTFNGARFFLGCLVLLPILIWRYCVKKRPIKEPKKLIKGGSYCGIILFVAASLQQISIQFTQVGKAGFLTALYIIFVPILGIMMKKRCSHYVWAGVFLSLVGFYLLSIQSSFSINRADILLLLSAFCFAIHILIIDTFSPVVDGIAMSCIQFFVASLLSWIMACLNEKIVFEALHAAMIPVLYAGVLSSGVGYTLQIIGQKGMNPTVASLLLSLESVFSVLAGSLILHEYLSIKELIGCAFVFLAIILAQIPDSKMKRE